MSNKHEIPIRFILRHTIQIDTSRGIIHPFQRLKNRYCNVPDSQQKWHADPVESSFRIKNSCYVSGLVNLEFSVCV